MSLKNRYVYLIFAGMLFISASASAQYDIELAFQKPRYYDWDKLIAETADKDQQIFDWKAGVGFAYRIFPHEFRLGYRPGLHVFYGQKELIIADQTPTQNYRIIQSYLSFPVQVFPFDLWGDCNCPTFGRQNDFFQKAFYLEFLPAISIKQLSYSNSNVSTSVLNVAAHVGFGAGLNIAMNKLLTFSPMLSYHIGMAEKWDGLGVLHDMVSDYDQTFSSGWQLTIKTSLYLSER